ncbi:flagellar biosynthesis protein FliQ [Roseateles sp.]|uniref:flagellar biosynthesis protein FliQ n=1 Tax=Roseateles sp. TaxID=1971397 RepID=UPI003BA4F720
MDAQQVFTFGQQGLYVLMLVSAPILLVVLLVGVLVSVFQAATQINESTLSFVPKVVAAVLTLSLTGPWMVSTLVDYIRRTLMTIPQVVG